MDNNQSSHDINSSNTFFTAVVQEKPKVENNDQLLTRTSNASMFGNTAEGKTPPIIPSNPQMDTSQSLNVSSGMNPPLSNLPKNKFNIKFLFIFLIILVFSVIGYFIFTNQKKSVKKKEKAKTIELKYWGLFEEQQIIEPVIKDYEAQNPGIKIIYSKESHFEYRERLQRRLAEGSGPDIFRFHQSWVPMLGEYLDTVPQNTYDDQTYSSIFYPSARESLKYKSKYVGIPLMVDGLALYYNEDIFKDAGKLPPTTWEELRKVASELTVRDSQGKITTAGIAMGTTNNVDHWSDILGMLMLQNGADLTNPGLCTGTGQDKICLGADALSFYTVFLKGDRPVWNGSLPSSTFYFATGKLAMYFAPSWRSFELKTQNPSLNFRTLPVPQLSGKSVAWSTYWAEGVNKKSANSQAAWDFLKYLSSKEVLQKLFQLQSATRMFGEPYPRTDMAEMLKDHPIIGSYIQQAPYSKSWQLSSFTKDSGVNDGIIEYYANAVNGVNEGKDASTVLDIVSQGVAQIFSKYNSSFLSQ